MGPYLFLSFQEELEDIFTISYCLPLGQCKAASCLWKKCSRGFICPNNHFDLFLKNVCKYPLISSLMFHTFVNVIYPGRDEGLGPSSPTYNMNQWGKSWWRHEMEAVSASLALCVGNSPVPVNSPHRGQWRGALMFSLIGVWINGWVNNREAGDLRRHRGHYDVNVMSYWLDRIMDHIRCLMLDVCIRYTSDV